MAISFCKFHGFGNDYIVIERQHIPSHCDIPGLARAICHRHTGAGGDGIAVIGPAENDADFYCEIINPDGSIAGFSGNGTRCAVSYLYFSGAWASEKLRLLTRSGIKNYTLIERHGGTEFWFDAEIGTPKFASDEVPVALDNAVDAVLSERITLADRDLVFAAVNVGNPVACIFVDEFPEDWRELGREAESHTLFPERVNFVFVKVIDRGTIEIRIWERGAGETSASGTCSAGSAVLSMFMLKTDRAINVVSPGGVTRVEWRQDGEIVLRGRADLAYTGYWP